jgi:hypothetical protein
MQQPVARTMVITTVAGVVFFIVEYRSSCLGDPIRWIGTVLLGKLSERRKGLDPDVA